MTLTPHRVRRQAWRVTALSRECAFAIRERFRAQVDGELLQAFDRGFDALGVGDDVVRIPRLELEIRLRPDEGASDAIARIVAERVGEALRQWAAQRSGEMQVNRVAPPADRRRTLLHYLAHGQVEWHVGTEPPESLAQMLRDEAMALVREPGALGRVLHGTVGQRLAAAFRLLELLPLEERAALVGRVAVREFDGMPRALVSLVRGLLAPRAPPGYASLRVEALSLVCWEAEPGETADAEIADLLRECLEQVAPFTGSADVRAALEATFPMRGGAPKPAAFHGMETPDARRDSASPGEGTLARDAGLVLLHPYLERLFEAVAIARDDAGAISEAALPRAAALLHWLIAGREEIHEFELATIKVLLGVAPERTLLVAPGLLSEEDRAEADALLAAAISHWPVLGETSIDGLRRTFLQRRGALRDLGHAWSLQVEPAAFDVLLASLPWTFGIVRLPWMTRPIFIEWPTP